MKSWIVGAGLAGTMTLSASAGAEGIFLSLKAGGADVQGDTAQRGRENTIECVAFQQAVETPREAGSGMATGRRTYQPITCTKRVDRASPLLQKALTTNQVVEGSFKFFRPSRAGAEEQYYTIAFRGGRVASIKTVNKDAPAQGTFEEVSFVFQTISWTFTSGGITHEDTWNAAR